MKTLARTLALLAAALLALAACSTDPATDDAPAGAPVEDPVITIEDMAFQNGSIVVEAGTTVTWVWEDAPIEHNVVSDDGLFESPLQSEGTWTYTFEEPGTYDYHCQPHPMMTGTIEVVEA